MLIDIKDRLDLLNKIKKVTFIGETQYLTTEMVADYFNVKIEAIKTICLRDKEDVNNSGVTVLSGLDLVNFKELNGIKSRANAIRLFNLKALMYISCVLRKSKVAEDIRKLIIEHDAFSKDFSYILHKPNRFLIKENNTYEILNNTFDGIAKIYRSVSYNNYYLDFLLEFKNTKIVVECDEFGHGNYNKEMELEREREIKANFKLIRFNPDCESVISLINNIIKEVA